MNGWLSRAVPTEFVWPRMHHRLYIRFTPLINETYNLTWRLYQSMQHFYLKKLIQTCQKKIVQINIACHGPYTIHKPWQSVLILCFCRLLITLFTVLFCKWKANTKLYQVTIRKAWWKWIFKFVRWAISQITLYWTDIIQLGFLHNPIR